MLNVSTLMTRELVGHWMNWLKTVLPYRPEFGYFPQPAKSQLLVKSSFKNSAEAMFQNYGKSVVTGETYRDSFMGPKEGRVVKEKPQERRWKMGGNNWCCNQSLRVFPVMKCSWIFLDLFKRNGTSWLKHSLTWAMSKVLWMRKHEQTPHFSHRSTNIQWWETVIQLTCPQRWAGRIDHSLRENSKPLERRLGRKVNK